MRLNCAALTDTGVRRTANEDSYCVREDLGLFVVADGMGGHVAGEVAARVAIEELERFVAGTKNTGPGDTWPVPFNPKLGQNGNRLSAGMTEANHRSQHRSNAMRNCRAWRPQLSQFWLTETLRPWLMPEIHAHTLFRNKEFLRLTRDHSWVEEQMRAGALTAEVARDHPWRNIVTRALTGTPDLEVEVAESFQMDLADRLLLCSDGLTTVLSDEEIATVVTSDLGLQSVCEELVRQANAQGGPDNITVVLIDVDAL
ncbi:MAG: protein-serine/threonine phosphatase [Acidobacteriota bacterium]|nr:MAG: protein-serine/threonine phosphatase [Acidobacteriota bacterium]